MAEPFGIVAAAAGIAVANEILLNPAAHGETPSLASFNWRILPATIALGLVLQGMNTVSPPFAKGLASMTLLAVLLVKTNTEKASPLENLAAVVENRGQAKPPTPAPKKGKKK